MTKTQFLEHHGNKRIKEVAGTLHIYLKHDSMDKHYELDNFIMINNTMKVKEAIEKIDYLLEFDKE